jgi:hypothetical protein
MTDDPYNRPAAYPDGSQDDTARAIDVLADALTTPSEPAAPEISVRVASGDVTVSFINDRWIVTMPARYVTAIPVSEGMHVSLHLTAETLDDLCAASESAIARTDPA